MTGLIFVSDTPHTELFLLDLLASHGLAKEPDRVFTSAVQGVSKSAGGLFGAVARELAPATRSLTKETTGGPISRPHALRDGRVAMSPRAALSKYENLLEEHAAETGSFTSYLAGASRLARLEARVHGIPSARADVAKWCSLLPYSVGYAVWVVAQARLRGIKRLYYVARDGQAMLAVARHVVGTLAPDLELRYLFGSRQPWNLGVRPLGRGDAVLGAPTFGLHRAQCTQQGLVDPRKGLRHHGPSDDSSGQKPIVRCPRQRAVSSPRPCCRNRSFQLVRHEAQEQSERAIAYLVQQGLTDGTPSALVDAGWNGHTAKAFDVLLAAAGGSPVTHLVLGLTGTPEDVKAHAGVDLVPWLFDQQQHPRSAGRSPVAERPCGDALRRHRGHNPGLPTLRVNCSFPCCRPSGTSR